jgi:translation initiation factor IF-1
MKTEFEKWLDKVNEARKSYWATNFTYKPYEPLTYKKGSKFVKIFDGHSVWAFVSMKDGMHKGVWVTEGDLMKAESYSSAARHSRGNIFKGTDSWNFYGPNYLL